MNKLFKERTMIHAAGLAGRPRFTVPDHAHPLVHEFARLLEGLLLQEVADASGYSESTIRNIRHNGNPRLKTLDDILNAIGYELCIRPVTSPGAHAPNSAAEHRGSFSPHAAHSLKGPFPKAEQRTPAAGACMSSPGRASAATPLLIEDLP